MIEYSRGIDTTFDHRLDGMVVERQRKTGELDHLRWYCEQCGAVLHDAAFQLEDLASQLKPIIEQFYADESVRTCKSCQTVMQPPPPVNA